MAADKCHAVAHTPNGAVPGMSDAHPCRNNAKADLAKDGVNYPVCGMHVRVLRRGAHGIEAYTDRFARTGRVRLARHDPHVLAFRAEHVPAAWQPTPGTFPAPPPGPRRTTADVRRWLHDLDARGILWHMDDSADSVVWGGVAGKPDKAALRALARGQAAAWRICEREGVDIFTLYPVKPEGVPEGAVGYEAECPKCGETFNPNGKDDLEHGEREDGEECGGKGVLVGWW